MSEQEIEYKCQICGEEISVYEELGAEEGKKTYQVVPCANCAEFIAREALEQVGYE